MSAQIIPGAVTVAVTSGKGGAGKTTTAVALAATLAARGIDVILIDADTAGPNGHLVADVDDTTLGVDSDDLTLDLPQSPHGFRLISPTALDGSTAKAQAGDLIAAARFAPPSQVVVVDLPPGWTQEHEVVCHTMPDLVLCVVAPTRTALADHARHVEAWTQSWSGTVRHRKDQDRRRKLDLPAAPTVVCVETLARFTGLPEGGGPAVTIRRSDAVAAQEMADAVSPVTSIPAVGDIAALAGTAELAVLADIVEGRDPDEAAQAS